MSHRRVALLLEYDGSEFSGSQFQTERRTVQGVLEEAVWQFTGERLRAVFAGRTDTGVHASGQVAAIGVPREREVDTVRRALNHFLPDDVVVRAVSAAPPGFDPRRDAVGRTYRYVIEDGGERSPLRRRRAWQLPHPLDEVSMARAAASLPRTPVDWAAFAGSVEAGYPTVRTVRRVSVVRCGPDRIEVVMEADGFLPHQVRRTVGAFERVGRGRLDAGRFARLLEGAASTVGPAAPPQGLELRSVQYPSGLLRWDEETAV